jgi:hypothetical protein
LATPPPPDGLDIIVVRADGGDRSRPSALLPAAVATAPLVLNAQPDLAEGLKKRDWTVPRPIGDA